MLGDDADVATGIELPAELRDDFCDEHLEARVPAGASDVGEARVGEHEQGVEGRGAEAKVAAFRQAGVIVVDRPDQIPEAIKG